MKKILFALSVLSLFTFMSCQPVTSGSGNDDAQVSKWGGLEAKAIYNKFLGTWKHEDGTAPTASNGFDTVIFASDSITLGTIKYKINQDTDLIKSQDYNGTSVYNGTNYFGNIYIKLSDRLLGIESSKVINGTEYCYIMWNLYENENLNCLDKVSSSNSSGGGDISSVNGTYSFNNATGTQKNGSITLSDGNWTYSGSKTNAPSGGTYTVSGSDITFSWTANGYSVSTTVTVSKSGSSVTLSSSEVVFFSTFFNSTAQSDGKYSLTFNYSE